MGNQSTSDTEYLIKQLPTKGWKASNNIAGSDDQTLEGLARAAHAQRLKGEAVGTIKNIENELQLDLMQLEKLWIYLGLPV